jgi:hypothetical protein
VRAVAGTAGGALGLKAPAVGAAIAVAAGTADGLQALWRLIGREPAAKYRERLERQLDEIRDALADITPQLEERVAAEERARETMGEQLTDEIGAVRRAAMTAEEILEIINQAIRNMATSAVLEKRDRMINVLVGALRDLTTSAEEVRFLGRVAAQLEREHVAIIQSFRGHREPLTGARRSAEVYYLKIPRTLLGRAHLAELRQWQIVGPHEYGLEDMVGSAWVDTSEDMRTEDERAADERVDGLGPIEPRVAGEEDFRVTLTPLGEKLSRYLGRMALPPGSNV